MLKLIILGTGTVTKKVVERCLETKQICLLGCIPDESVDKESIEKYIQYVSDLGIEVLELSNESLQKADLIFSPEYRKIIPSEFTRKYSFVNCHGGILPYYRGFAANAWAIMNGSNEIGYTFHEVNEKLDDGKIYFVDRIPLKETQTYSDVHDEMVRRIVENAPKVLLDIYEKKIEGFTQIGKRIYCNRFSPKMGEIKDFNVEAEYIYRLYRCMAKPLGTGIYFNYKGSRYNVDKVDLGKNREVDDYIGIPGKIVNIENEELWIKTQDNVIIFSGITDEKRNSVKIDDCFRNGNQLGVFNL